MSKKSEPPKPRPKYTKNVESYGGREVRTYDRAINNAEKLNSSVLAGKQVLCPACDRFVFSKWPSGWDGHASDVCRGMTSISRPMPEERKAEFKRRYKHLIGQEKRSESSPPTPRPKNKEPATPIKAIINTAELEYSTVVGEMVVCPACKDFVFEKWPSGWDSHAKSKCQGLEAVKGADRKKEFKKRFKHLFSKE